MRRSVPSPPDDKRERVALASLGLLVFTLTLTSVYDGLRLVGEPTTQLFVDPFGRFSSVRLPSWPEVSPTLRYTDQLIAADDRVLPVAVAREGHAGTWLRAQVQRASALGRSTLTLTFLRDGRQVRVTRELRPLGLSDIVYFLLLNHGVSALALWVAVSVRYLSPGRLGGRAFMLWALGVSFFLATFTDYHGHARFRALFSFGSGWLLLGVLAITYGFPDRPVDDHDNSRRLWKGGALATLVVTAWAIVAPYACRDAFVARAALGNGVVLSLLVLTGGLVARYRRASGHRRVELQSAIFGIISALVVIALGFILLTVTGSTIIHFFLPLVTCVIPLSIGWALVRHNILGANAVLTRRLLAFPISLFAVGASVGVWLALRSGEVHGPEPTLPIMASLMTFGAVVAGLRRAVTRVLFPATGAFRPTIEQLAESLADPARAADLATALEVTISRWLPSGRVRLVKPSGLADIDPLPADAASRLRGGEKVWTDESPWERHLVVPLRSQGELRGALDIAPKHQGALFTEEDLNLLDTIAALGAIALHNAEILAELETARRLEVDATREDKRLTLGLLGAELSHEIAHPLLFFRTMLRRAARRPIDREDIEVGEEEIARMERMLQSLRRLETSTPELAPVSIREPVARAFTLVRERFRERGLREELDLPVGCVVQADADGFVQVFANLLRNATQGARSVVGVRVAALEDGALAIDTWDDGPGVPEDVIPKLFHRWVTSRAQEGGSGLGLSVAQRLVESFGWKIVYLRERDQTCFRVVVPAEKVVTRGA